MLKRHPRRQNEDTLLPHPQRIPASERILVSLWFSPPFMVRPLSPSLSLLDPQTNSLCDGGIVLVAQMVKNLLAVQETGVQSLGGEDPLE